MKMWTDGLGGMGSFAPFKSFGFLNFIYVCYHCWPIAVCLCVMLGLLLDYLICYGHAVRCMSLTDSYAARPYDL